MRKHHDEKGRHAPAQSKIAKSMREYKEGKLHSGSKHGPKVTERKQAIAIGMSEERKAKHGGKKHHNGTKHHAKKHEHEHKKHHGKHHHLSAKKREHEHMEKKKRHEKE